MIDLIALAIWVLTGLVLEFRTWRLGGQHLRHLGPAALFGPLWAVGNLGRRSASVAARESDVSLIEGPGATAVVVGYDGTNHSATALRWAAERAGELDVPLRIVHAFRVTAPSDAAGAYARVYAAAVDGAERRVGDVGARLSQSFPGLSIETVTGAGAPSMVIERHCSDAALLVLATRQQSGIRQWISQSVTNRLTGRVNCPVVSLPLAST